MPLHKPSVIPDRRFWTPLRIVTTVFAFVLLAMIGLSSCNSHEPPSSTSTAPKPGAAANMLPPNVRDAELRSVNGNPIKLGDYSGKVLLVNLWATWCGPCRSEIPELVRLHREFQAQGFEVVGLSTENPDASAESVRNFVSSFNMDYAVGWASPEVAVALMQGNGNIPQSFLITRDGRIIKRFVGFSPGNTPPQLRKAIADALKT